MTKDQYIIAPTTDKEALAIENENMYISDKERNPSKCKRFGSKLKGVVTNNLLLFSTIAGVLVGFGLGFAIRETEPTEDTLMWVGLPGQLYLRLLKMMIVPLIACSVICGKTIY